MNAPDLLTRVLDLTLQMERTVQMDDWECAARLARERNPRLMSLSAPNSPEVRVAIERIRTLTMAINQRAETARSELSSSWFPAALRNASGAAYQRAARLHGLTLQPPRRHASATASTVRAI